MELLRRNPLFRTFWSARAVSFVGDGMALIALLLYVQETRESGIAVSLLLLAATIPRLLGPLAGAVADRFEQRRLMVACDLGQAALYAAIAASLPPLMSVVASPSPSNDPSRVPFESSLATARSTEPPE